VSARIGNSSYWFSHTAAPRRIFAGVVTTVVVTINASQLRCAGHAVIDGIVYITAHMVAHLSSYGARVDQGPRDVAETDRTA
jgi:hypothetical protein